VSDSVAGPLKPRASLYSYELMPICDFIIKSSFIPVCLLCYPKMCTLLSQDVYFAIESYLLL
jgi:hypothetical protein